MAGAIEHKKCTAGKISEVERFTKDPAEKVSCFGNLT
jgi:hypothetical protein